MLLRLVDNSAVLTTRHCPSPAGWIQVEADVCWLVVRGWNFQMNMVIYWYIMCWYTYDTHIGRLQIHSLIHTNICVYIYIHIFMYIWKQDISSIHDNLHNIHNQKMSHSIFSTLKKPENSTDAYHYSPPKNGTSYRFSLSQWSPDLNSKNRCFTTLGPGEKLLIFPRRRKGVLQKTPGLATKKI